jgi:hypothetical protein
MKNVPAASLSTRFLQMLLIWLLLPGGWLLGEGGARSAGEYQVKAVFLYNFTKFVYWPEAPGAPGAARSPFVIGILGEDPFGAALAAAVRQESVQGRPIVIQQFQSGDSIAGCNILFIARSEKDRLDTVLQQARGRAILTVADTAKAAEQGVMINLSLDDGSVKMEINQQAVESAGLKVSAKLLSLAKIINPKADQPPSRP